MFLAAFARLVEMFKNLFSVFKQYYTYFHLYIIQKNTNNITQTFLPNGPKEFRI